MGGREQKRLVKADSGAAIRECAQPLRSKKGVGDRRVENHEVVAGPVHLCELDAHWRKG